MIRRLLKDKGRAAAPKGRKGCLKGGLACAAAILLAAGLDGCVADRTEFDNPTPPAGGRAATFTVTVPGMKAPSTRALTPGKEQEIAEIDVVIFDNSDQSLVEYHRVPDINPSGSNWQFNVRDIDHANNITVAIIANASAEVSKALTTLANDNGGSYTGVHKLDFLEALLATRTGKWNTTDNNYWRIPMYGEVKVTGSIYDQGALNADLVRMLARVDVLNDKHPEPSFGPRPGDFVLTKVHVVHYNTCGRVAPKWQSDLTDDPTNRPVNTGKILWQNDGDELTYEVVEDGTEMDIYLFECQAQSGVTVDPENPAPDRQTRLIFEGLYYNSNGEPEHYYYPVDFRKDRNPDVPGGWDEAQEYIHVLRNYCYKFHITEVSGRGYDNMGEAVKAMGVISNMKTSLLVVDEGGIRNIVWNGEYFLGTEDREVTLGGSAGSLATVKVSTNYAEGWKIDTDKGTNGIEYTDGTGWLSATPATSGDPKSTLELEILETNDSGGERTAIVHLKAGRLTHTLTVIQQRASIAPRFARSNIVWDAANQKLTFATTVEENTTVAPANAQGVFFKWGSLVAISPVGTSNAFDPSQILYKANSYATYSVWEGANDIPYANETSGKFGTNNTDEDDFDDYGPGGTGYNVSADKGDICRYISAKGWVPAGENWRLPTMSEFQELMDEFGGFPYSVQYPANGGFTNINYLTPSTPGYDAAWDNGYWQVPSGRWLGSGATADAATGEQATKIPGTNSVYFPAGGNRNANGDASIVGYNGFAWSGSSYNTMNAHYLYVVSTRTYGAFYARYLALPVRCIRDDDQQAPRPVYDFAVSTTHTGGVIPNIGATYGITVTGTDWPQITVRAVVAGTNEEVATSATINANIGTGTDNSKSITITQNRNWYTTGGRWIEFQWSIDGKDWFALTKGDQTGMSHGAPTLNTTTIAGAGQRITVSVPGDYPNNYIMVQARSNGMDNQQQWISASTRTGTITIPKNETGAARDIVFEYHKLVNGQWDSWIEFATISQPIGNVVLSTGRVVANADVAASGTTWALAMGIDTRYNTESFTDNNQPNYPMTKNTGCGAYFEKDVNDPKAGVGQWRLPTYDELGEMYSKRGEIGNMDTTDNYWSARENESDVKQARYVYFGLPTMYFGVIGKDAHAFVRCVRKQ